MLNREIKTPSLISKAEQVRLLHSLDQLQGLFRAYDVRRMLGAALDAVKPGARPFAGITRDRALQYLRRLLARLGVEQPESYGTQDLRRGHNEDLVRAGKKWQEILWAGGWRAPGRAIFPTQGKGCDEWTGDASNDTKRSP